VQVKYDVFVKSPTMPLRDIIMGSNLFKKLENINNLQHIYKFKDLEIGCLLHEFGEKT